MLIVNPVKVERLRSSERLISFTYALTINVGVGTSSELCLMLDGDIINSTDLLLDNLFNGVVAGSIEHVRVETDSDNYAFVVYKKQGMGGTQGIEEILRVTDITNKYDEMKLDIPFSNEEDPEKPELYGFLENSGSTITYMDLEIWVSASRFFIPKYSYPANTQRTQKHFPERI